MILIPIGLKENEVRRLPWISYVLIAMNLVVFAALQFQSAHSDVPERFDAKAREVSDYLLQNPYLEIPSDLKPFCAEQTQTLLAEARSHYLRGNRPPDDWYIQRQQQKLGELTAQLLAIGREALIQRYGFVPAHPTLLAALTSMFVHSGWLHLIGNMLFFFATGPFLEDVFGRLLFALLYVFSGFAGLAAHVWQYPASSSPLVGASAAIAGVMGAFLIRLGTSRIRFLWLPFPVLPWIRLRFFVPAFLFLPFWFLIQFWLANHVSANAGVAFWGHVGGFVFGAALALLVLVTGLEKRWIHPAIESQVSWNQNEGLVRAIEAGTRGDLEAARRTTGRVLAQDPTNLDAWRYAYEISLQTANWKELGIKATRLLEMYLQRNEKDLAKQLIREASSHAFDELPVKFLLRAGSFLDREGDGLWAIQFYDAVAERHWEDSGTLRSLLRVADLHKTFGDRNAARKALARALTHPHCSGEWKEAVEKKLRELDPTAPSGARAAPKAK